MPLCLLALVWEGSRGPVPENSSLSMPRPCVFYPVCASDQGLGLPAEGELHRDSFLVQDSFCLQYLEQGGAKTRLLLPLLSPSQDTEDLDHYEMKEEEPADGKKTEDEGIGKENLAILEKIKKNQRQDYLNVRVTWWAGGLGKQRDPRARAMGAPGSPKSKGPKVQQWLSGAGMADAEKSVNCLCSAGK